jgi:hypothetical protein
LNKIDRNPFFGFGTFEPLCRTLSPTSGARNPDYVYFVKVFVSWTIIVIVLFNSRGKNGLMVKNSDIYNNYLLTLFVLRLGSRLGYHVWTCVLEVLEALVSLVENKQGKPLDPISVTLATEALVECIGDVEHLLQTRQFYGSEKRAFALIER